MKRLGKAAALLAAFSLVASPTAWAAAPQKFTFKLYGDCKESSTVGIIIEDETNNCRIDVKVSSAKPLRILVLQVFQDGKWVTATDQDEPVTSRTSMQKTGRLDFPLYDEDGAFLEGTFKYRVQVEKASDQAATKSGEFSIQYKSNFDESDD